MPWKLVKMNLTDIQLKEIEENAALFLEPEEIAVLMDLDTDEFIEQLQLKKGAVYQAYFRGRTTSKKEILENVVKMAKHGSPQAEDLAKQFMDKQLMAEKRGRK